MHIDNPTHDATTIRHARIEPDRGRVLLAEDDEDLRELIAVTLRKAGYQVTEAWSGNLAVERFRRLAASGPDTLPDVIVSDVRMADGDGLQVVRSLRDLGWAVPVILMSAFVESVTAARALGLGATAVLAKPLSMVNLLDTVGHYVEPRF